MTLLDQHLEQIELCAATIAELPFPPPKMFTNAMLNNHDITALIRDTEDHERALFSLVSPNESISSSDASRRRTTTYHQPDVATEQQRFRAPRKGTAVAAVLGGDLSVRIRREYARDAQEPQSGQRREKDNLDVELLLKGAERLCGVYPIAGALDRIASLRLRNAKVMESTEKYEALVAEQSAELGRMNQSNSLSFDDTQRVPSRGGDGDDKLMTEEEFRMEEQGIVELEKRKKVLEERVTGMEKDLGGLMR